VTAAAAASAASATGRAVVAIVCRGRRRLLEYQRTITVRIAVGTAVLQIVRQQRMSTSVALVRL